MTEITFGGSFPADDPTVNKEQMTVALEEVKSPSELSTDDALLEVSKGSKVFMMAIFCLILTVNGLDLNVLGDAGPFIAAHFNAFDRINWLSNTTVLIASSFMLISAKLFGCIEPKYIIVASLVLLVLADSLAGASSSFEMLLAGRSIAGISQSLNLIGATTVVGLITDSKSRPLMVSMVIACYGLLVLPVSPPPFTANIN